MWLFLFCPVLAQLRFKKELKKKKVPEEDYTAAGMPTDPDLFRTVARAWCPAL